MVTSQTNKSRLTQLRRLDEIQKRAVKIIGSGVGLDPLPHRRLVSSLCFLHRMHKPDQPELVQSLLPARMQSARNTRSTSAAAHALRPLAGRTTTGLWSLQQYDRSYLPSAITAWNSRAPKVIGCPKTDSTKDFCRRAHHYLLSKH